MANGQLKLQTLRTNDLVEDSGKQVEFGTKWNQFFGIPETAAETTLSLTFKAVRSCDTHLDGKVIELKLSELTNRNDRKVYANSENGYSQIKDFFINSLHLGSENIGKDYFALYKQNDTQYLLFFVPQLLYDNFVYLFNNNDIVVTTTKAKILKNNSQKQFSNAFLQYLSAIRTKPFLLLAGISGTGKSRIVKELAYSSCPNDSELRSDSTSPGNYCLVEVKPNWNDSTELLGYETVLDGGGYHLTKFVKFIVKAMQHEDVPFFVCLDEMNLAPVEQYFAEFLSVLESRKDVVVNGKATIQSEPLIDAAIFEKYSDKLYAELFPKNEKDTKPTDGYVTHDELHLTGFYGVFSQLMQDGLRIPRNLIVIGTVNMDDTTYQFSRKVIDRAMTIEMNEVNLDNMFDPNKADTLNYPDEVVNKDWFFAPFAQSDKALPMIVDEERTQLINKIKETIGQTEANGAVTPNSLEEILGKTPFRIAYRVVNELVLHFYALRQQDNKAEFEELFNTALDNILMMKVLPRIEGNEDLVKKPLTAMMNWTSESYPRSNQKIVEMKNRLDIQHFTSFWP